MRVGSPVRAALFVLLLFPVLPASIAHAEVEVPPDYRVLPPVDPISPVNRDRLNRQVDPAWSAAALGSNKGLAIDAYSSSDRLEVADQADVPRMPASTTKLLTATAVLETFGPQHRFTTSVVRDGDRIVLVGGGDPQLTSLRTPAAVNANASLVPLARQTAEALLADGVSRVELDFDASLFAPATEPPFWEDDFLEIGVVAPPSALMTDAGRLNPPAAPRSPNPALTTTQQFSRLLQDQGITVTGQPTQVQAEGDAIAEVKSPPLADLVEHMLLVSDNTEADVLAHQVGRKVLKDPTFAGGARATIQVLDDLGIDTNGIVLEDGSGLARANRISPSQLVAVLNNAIEGDPEKLWPVYTGLPFAGFDGSLTYRFSSRSAQAARGAATGKTGTLTGTSALAGLVSDRDGQLMVYAAMTNQVSVWPASGAIDTVVARAAKCHCGGTSSP